MGDIVYGREKRIGVYVSVDAHADLLRERDALRAEVERLKAALMDVHAHLHLRKYSETREVIDAALEKK